MAYPIDFSLASYDLKNNIIQLFCKGGFIVLAPTPSDKIFENMYSVKYRDLGCVVPNLGELKLYNQRIAFYLDEKYGIEWRQTVRADIIGVSW
jgi:hypothetical protein